MGARTKRPTTGREQTVSRGDFEDPDSSLVGIYLRDAGACLTLLDDLHCDALQIDYSPLSEDLGLTRDDLLHALRGVAVEMANQRLVKAREALHDLFREVELKEKTPAPKAVA